MKKQENGHYHHDFRYLFVIDKLEDVTTNCNESNGYKWININDLLDDENFKLTTKKIINLIEKEINRGKIYGIY